MVVYAATNLILENLLSVLTTKLITDIDSDDKTRVSEIKIGKLQDDPTRDLGLNILIVPPNDSTPVTIYTSQAGLSSPVYEIGGGVYLMSPFTLKFIFHFKGESNRDVARTKAFTIFARAKQTILKMGVPIHPVTGLPQDDFGETIIEYQFNRGFLDESGGPGHFIWRGFMYIGFLSEQENRYFSYD